jgi:hypothetical protein
MKSFLPIFFLPFLFFSCSNEPAEVNESIVVSFTTDSYSASEEAVNSEVIISIEVIGGVTSEDAVISLAIDGGTADTADVSDTLPVLITIPADDYTTMSTFDISLSIVDDDIEEDTENLILSLTSVSDNVFIDVTNQVNITITDNDSTFELQGLEFALINYIVEVPMDLNNDGIFSTDLLEEDIICVMDTIEFRPDNIVFDPTYRSTGLVVVGNTQQEICVDPDGSGLTYELVDGIINLSFLQQYYYSGVLSNDNTIIEFDIPFEYIIGFGFFGGNQYISQNNGVQSYTGGVIAIYEIIE